ncbi:MAG: hypothetical protein HKM28_00185, partial [Flavobacteriaceae bacterium]|nr:hypothetical protein [Flavobacteriaceae bacterium]
MKNKLHILLITLGLVLVGMHFQSCRDDEMFQNVAITSQEELDRLLAEDGGNPRYEGDLLLTGEITSLTSLSHLEKIIGNLVIIDTELESLDGLENLNLVTGDILIRSTPPNVQEIRDFCALRDLLISGNFKSILIYDN